MTQTIALLQFLDPTHILQSLGAWALAGVVAIIFAECGLLIGFFLPGDSLLFITGLFVASGAIRTNLILVVILLAVAAVLGNICGYWIGHAIGPKLFDRPDSRIFKKEYVEKTHTFFERYGARAIVLARFVPIVRTFITAMAGTAKMDFRVFVTFSAIGGILWAVGVTLLGYYLGQFDFVKRNIEIMLILIVLLSLVPVAIEIIKHRREAKDIADDIAG